MPRLSLLAALLVALGVLLCASAAAAAGGSGLDFSFYPPGTVPAPSAVLPFAAAAPPEKRPADCPECPACFNCQLPAFTCAQFGTCSQYDGLCSCPVGFGGQDCVSAAYDIALLLC